VSKNLYRIRREILKGELKPNILQLRNISLIVICNDELTWIQAACEDLTIIFSHKKSEEPKLISSMSHKPCWS